MGDHSQYFPLTEHDHGDCITDALTTAERLCREGGLRLTPMRRQVLALVWQSHKPVGAYEILERLDEDGRKTAPPTVYRALEFLIEAGLVHRLDSLNAYIGCGNPDNSHTGQFLICRNCRTVAELDDAEINAMVAAKATALGFTAVRPMLEIEGLCSSCRAHVQRG